MTLLWSFQKKLKLICMKMEESLKSSSQNSKIEIMHGKTCKISLRRFADTFQACNRLMERGSQEVLN